jgi:glutaredoxin
MSEYRLEVYTGSWCPNCTVLKAALKEANVPFDQIDADSEEGMDKAIKMGVRGGLPTTIVYLGDEVVRKIVGLQPTSVYTAYVGDEVVRKIVCLQPTSVYTAYVKGTVDNDEGAVSE